MADNANMSKPSVALSGLLQSMENAARQAGRPPARLLAVSKTQPAEAVARLADAGQKAFGENYVQEAMAKVEALSGRGLEWHLIGHLQSNKCREAARCFDWVQTVDRPKLVAELDRHRDASLAPLNILIQVNPDGEAGKSGCAPAEIAALARLVEAAPHLRLRGLMAIPEPHPDPELRRATFAGMAQCFATLRAEHPGVDTLSMGMSGDYELAIAEGATMIRVGTALFGARA
jgi:pyridoxal phosphate enzyme (YggS family)